MVCPLFLSDLSLVLFIKCALKLVLNTGKEVEAEEKRRRKHFTVNWNYIRNASGHVPTAKCSLTNATGLSHLCVTLLMRKADVCRSHPVLRVTTMNVTLSVPFLTSDWVLSKLLLFSTHSSTAQAFSIQLSPPESVWADKKF